MCCGSCVVWKPAAGFEGLIDDSEDSAVSDHDDLFVPPKNLTITGTDRRSTRQVLLFILFYFKITNTVSTCLIYRACN